VSFGYKSSVGTAPHGSTIAEKPLRESPGLRFPVHVAIDISGENERPNRLIVWCDHFCSISEETIGTSSYK
jgi:hypothetical protein